MSKTLRRYTDRASRTTVAVLGVAVVAVAVLAAYFALVSPSANALSASRESLASAREEQTRMSKSLVTLTRQCSDIATTTDDLDRFGSYFPSSAAQQQLFDTIVDTGRSAGVEISGINPTTPDVSSAVLGAEVDPAAPAAQDAASGAAAYPLAQVDIEITGTGSVESTSAFIDAVESLNPSVLIDTVDVQNTEDSKVVISGRTFVVSDLSSTLDKVNDTCSRSAGPAAKAGA